MKQYDLIVIGAGSAGLTAAYTGKGFGKKVLLVEKNKPGGECTWSGCIPSKTLINIAREVHIAKKYNEDLEVDTGDILLKVRESIQNVYEEEKPEAIIKNGVDYINGTAKFIDKNSIEVNGESIKANRIIICTGSTPFIPQIKGIEKVKYLTNENIFIKEMLPKNLIILGGGAIGVELSQAFNRIGIKISLVEMLDSILFREEADLAKLVKEKLINEGVKIHTSTKALEIKEVDKKIYLKVEKGGKEEILEADGILLALGRKPNLKELNLQTAGINFNNKGIIVNEYLETNVKGVYAIGDVVGPYQFSHMANFQGITAVQNAVLPFNKKINYSHVAWCTFTEPELARAGLTEVEAKIKYGEGLRIYTESYSKLDRAKIKSSSEGLVKIICDKKGRILGASIFGERAGEIICEIQAIKTLGINLGKLSTVIHPYPTYSEILLKISKRVYVDNLLNNVVIRFINRFRK